MNAFTSKTIVRAEKKALKNYDEMRDLDGLIDHNEEIAFDVRADLIRNEAPHSYCEKCRNYCKYSFRKHLRKIVEDSGYTTWEFLGFDETFNHKTRNEKYIENTSNFEGTRDHRNTGEYDGGEEDTSSECSNYWDPDNFKTLSKVLNFEELEKLLEKPKKKDSLKILQTAMYTRWSETLYFGPAKDRFVFIETKLLALARKVDVPFIYETILTNEKDLGPIGETIAYMLRKGFDYKEDFLKYEEKWKNENSHVFYTDEYSKEMEMNSHELYVAMKHMA